MNKLIFDKTNKGREEIATRKYGLAPRMRSLLVLVDGKKSKAELLSKVAGLGLTDQSVVELIENEFIENINGAPAVTTIATPPVTSSAATEPALPPLETTSIIAEPVVAEVIDVIAEGSSGVEASNDAIEKITSEEITPEQIPDIEIKPIAAEQLQALHAFFNETIKSNIGLRGFSLQLKAEQARTMLDFHDLRIPYLEAVLKAKGQEMTLALRNKLDQLLDDAEKTTV